MRKGDVRTRKTVNVPPNRNALIARYSGALVKRKKSPTTPWSAVKRKRESFLGMRS